MSRAARSSCRPRRWRWIPASCTSGTSSTRRTPIHIGRFTISDFEGKHRWLYLPEVLAYSSNLGAAHIAETSAANASARGCKSMGMFGRVGIELPEAGHADHPAGGGLEGDRDDDRGVRPRHLGLAAARGARHGGGRDRRSCSAPPSSALPPGERPGWACR